jgi:hypothetical protein
MNPSGPVGLSGETLVLVAVLVLAAFVVYGVAADVTGA